MEDGGSALFGGIWALFWLAILLLTIAGFWQTFVKAGEPGWAAIIPIYNLWVMCRVVGRPGWWVVLFFVPIASLIANVVISLDVAKSFGQGSGFGIGLWLLPFVFYPMLGFGAAEYEGPAAA